MRFRKLYECDGCGLQGSEGMVVEHVTQAIRNPDGTLKEFQDVACMGAMEIGGPAWRMAQQGISPSMVILAMVAEVARQYPWLFDATNGSSSCTVAGQARMP